MLLVGSNMATGQQGRLQLACSTTAQLIPLYHVLAEACMLVQGSHK